MSLSEIAHDSRNDPRDVVERMASGNNWPFERAGEDEIGIVVTGRWTNYQVSFTWMSDIEALHLACAFDMKIPEARRADVYTAAGFYAAKDGVLRTEDPAMEVPLAGLFQALDD